MSFEEIRLSEIKEEILAIEDFECVDEGLLAEINANDELRRFFDEIKALSSLIGASEVEPTHGGVSLHDAVMDRIEKGDTAPKYINSGRRYPFATAACLLMCVAVVFAVKSGIADRFIGITKSFDAAECEAADEENGAYLTRSARGMDSDGTVYFAEADITDAVNEESFSYKAYSGGETIISAPAEFKTAKAKNDAVIVADAENVPATCSEESLENAIDNALSVDFSSISNIYISKLSQPDCLFKVNGGEYTVFEAYGMYVSGKYDFSDSSFDDVFKRVYEILKELCFEGASDDVTILLDFVSEGAK